MYVALRGGGSCAGCVSVAAMFWSPLHQVSMQLTKYVSIFVLSYNTGSSASNR